jgi:hypothetical protein
VQQSFLPPSPEPSSGKVSPAQKAPEPSTRLRTDTVVETGKKKGRGKRSEKEKELPRRHSFTRSTSNEDSVSPLPTQVKGLLACSLKCSFPASH